MTPATASSCKRIQKLLIQKRKSTIADLNLGKANGNSSVENSLFNIKDTRNKNVTNLNKAITFNMMSRPFICRKRELIHTVYKHAVGTKSNKILKRPAVEKETEKDPMMDCKTNDTLMLDEI